MRLIWASTAFVVVAGGVLWAQAASASPTASQRGSGLLGLWERETVRDAPSNANDEPWGARVTISQLGSELTVRPASGSTERYKLDGTETAEVLMVAGCKNVARITKATADKDRVIITTWMVMKAGCLHDEVEEEPRIDRSGPISVREVFGTRKPDSVTVISREGDTLTVETTRSRQGVGPTTTTTTYRR